MHSNQPQQRQETPRLLVAEWHAFLSWCGQHDMASHLGDDLPNLRKAYRAARDLGLNGKILLKTVGKKTYIIIKGYPGLRAALTGTRYLASNPQVVHLSAAFPSAAQAAKTFTIVYIALDVPLRVLEELTSKNPDIYHLLGVLVTDAIKMALGAALTLGIATALGLSAAPAVAAIAGGVIIGIVVSAGIDFLDERIRINDQKLSEAFTSFVQTQGPKVAAAVEHAWEWAEHTVSDAYDSAVDTMAKEVDRYEKWLIDKALSGLPH